MAPISCQLQAEEAMLSLQKSYHFGSGTATENENVELLFVIFKSP
jgi:hypothetical protein